MALVEVMNTPAYISYAEESSPGVEESPVNWLAKVQSVDPTERNNVQRHRHLGALTFVSWTPGKQDNLVSLKVKVNEGKFFLMAFGSEAVVGGSAPYTHTLSHARPLPSFTLEVAAIESAQFFTRRFLGCKVQKVGWSADLSGVLLADIDIIASTVAKYTSKTTSTPNLAKPYNFDQATLTLNSSPVAIAKSFEHTLDNGIEGLNHLGSRFVNGYSEGGPIDDVTLALTGVDSTFYDLLKADPPTEIDGDINFVRTASNDEISLKWYDTPLDEAKVKPPDDVRGGAFTQNITLPIMFSEMVVIDAEATY